MNYWHDIDSGSVDELNVLIEIPKGSKNKYEIDKETGLIALDRVYHTSQDCPFDYGFVPQTLWDDGDALDVVLLTTNPLYPGILVKSRPVGIMRMTDSGESDDKVIAVPVSDPRWNHVQDIGDVNQHTIKEITHFFTTMKLLQNKITTVDKFEGKDKVAEALAHAQKLYKEKFAK
ncbi:MAG: inorganic diphosphatase [Patescibacteria group bacterium]